MTAWAAQLQRALDEDMSYLEDTRYGYLPGADVLPEVLAQVGVTYLDEDEAGGARLTQRMMVVLLDDARQNALGYCTFDVALMAESLAGSEAQDTLSVAVSEVWLTPSARGRGLSASMALALSEAVCACLDQVDAQAYAYYGPAATLAVHFRADVCSPSGEKFLRDCHHVFSKLETTHAPFRQNISVSLKAPEAGWAPAY